MKSDAQIEKIWFMGREVTDADRVKFEKVFEEPIEDFELFKAILAVSVKPEHLLARKAFGKALQYGYSSTRCLEWRRNMSPRGARGALWMRRSSVFHPFRKCFMFQRHLAATL